MFLRTSSPLARFSRALLALVFAAGSPSVGGAYRCCTVDAQQTTTRADVSKEVATAETHAHHRLIDESVTPAGAEESARADTAGADATAPQGAAEHPCECVGQCHGSPAQRPLVATIATIEVAPASVRATLIRGDSSAPVQRESHRQPFANGPPTTEHS